MTACELPHGRMAEARGVRRDRQKRHELQVSLREVHTVELGVEEVCLLEAGPWETAARQVGGDGYPLGSAPLRRHHRNLGEEGDVGQDGPLEVHLAGFGLEPVHVGKVGAPQRRRAQLGAGEDGLAQVGAGEARAFYHRGAQVRFFEHRAVEARLPKRGVGEHGARRFARRSSSSSGRRPRAASSGDQPYSGRARTDWIVCSRAREAAAFGAQPQHGVARTIYAPRRRAGGRAACSARSSGSSPMPSRRPAGVFFTTDGSGPIPASRNIWSTCGVWGAGGPSPPATRPPRAARRRGSGGPVRPSGSLP